VTYRGDTFTGRLNLQGYQMATTTDVTPYDRLPQVTFDGFLPYEPGGLKLDYKTEFVRFDRNLDDKTYFNDDGSIRGRKHPDAYIEGLARSTGDRVHLEPGMSLPMTRSWGYLTPTLKLLYTKYDLDLDSQGKSTLSAYQETFDSSQDRSLPLVKVDSGLYFDRDTTFAGT
ncbi:LPS assembly protein LptD, partial [Enterococcus faecalis]